MFTRKNKKTTDKSPTNNIKKAPSVISEEMHVLGNIISEGFIDIDGHIDGNVKCESAIIRENGAILGDLVADNLQIYGAVEGLVKARSVNLHQTAKVTGTIMYENLSVEDGAMVDGKFKRTNKVFSDDETNALRVSDDEAKDEPEESIMENLRLISE